MPAPACCRRIEHEPSRHTLERLGSSSVNPIAALPSVPPCDGVAAAGRLGEAPLRFALPRSPQRSLRAGRQCLPPPAAAHSGNEFGNHKLEFPNSPVFREVPENSCRHCRLAMKETPCSGAILQAAAAARQMRFPSGNRFLAGRQARGWGLGRRAPFRPPSPASRPAAALPPQGGRGRLRFASRSPRPPPKFVCWQAVPAPTCCRAFWRRIREP